MDRIADELYGLPPERFVARRDQHWEQAKKAKDKTLAREVKGLARPTQAAWLINQMLRHRRPDLEQLLELGAALRKAQQTLSAAELKELSAQRRTLLHQLGRESRVLAKELGQPVSQAVEHEVSATLGAAMADPQVAEQVRSGRLTRAVSHSGFGDLESVVLSRRKRPASESRARRESEKRERERAEATEALEKAEAARNEAQQKVEKLEAELREARTSLKESEAVLSAARRRAERSSRRASK